MPQSTCVMRQDLACENVLKQLGFQVRSSKTLKCDVVVPLGAGLSLQFLVRDLSLISEADVVPQVLAHLRTCCSGGIVVLVGPQRNPKKFLAVQNAVLSTTVQSSPKSSSSFPLLAASSMVDAINLIAWQVRLVRETKQELPPPVINVRDEIREAVGCCLPLERNFDAVFTAADKLSHVCVAEAKDFQAAVPHLSRKDAMAIVHYFAADTETKD